SGLAVCGRTARRRPLRAGRGVIENTSPACGRCRERHFRERVRVAVWPPLTFPSLTRWAPSSPHSLRSRGEGTRCFWLLNPHSLRSRGEGVGKRVDVTAKHLRSPRRWREQGRHAGPAPRAGSRPKVPL